MDKKIKLSASSAYRFNECPGSVHLEKNLDPGLIYNRPSDAATFGTLVHDMGDQALSALIKGARPIVPTMIRGLWRKDSDNYLKAENALTGYVAYFKKEWGWHKKTPGKTVVLIEEKTKYTRKNQVLVAKADCLIYTIDRKNKFIILTIADLKTGTFDYEAAAAQQLYFTALIFIVKNFKQFSGYEIEIRRDVIQPNVWENIRRLVHINLVDVTFKKAFGELGNLQIKIESNESLYNPGPHCTFCKAIVGCPYVKNLTDIFSLMATMEEIEEVDDKYLEFIFENKKLFESFLDQVQSIILHKLENGQRFDKLTFDSYSGKRRWVDENKVKRKLKFLGDKIYEDRKLKSPSALEKLAGKENIRDLYMVPKLKRVAMIDSPFEEVGEL